LYVPYMLITHHFYLPRETAGSVGSVKCDDIPLLPQTHRRGFTAQQTFRVTLFLIVIRKLSY